MAAPPLVLASTSPWRLQLLRDAGIPCAPADPAVDEEAIEAANPAALAAARARAKADAVAPRFPHALVLGADQVAHLDGVAFGKPRGERDWLARLRSLRGRTHTLTTAFCLVGPGGRQERSVDSRVRFRADLDDAELEAYVALGEAAGCAGGYMVERRGAWLIERVDGDWTNVVGLPVFAVVAALRERGWRLSPEPPGGTHG